jgi:hypothetical protein
MLAQLGTANMRGILECLISKLTLDTLSDWPKGKRRLTGKRLHAGV